MQIAKQVYRLKTAENALIFFKNASPAYITKRFDVKEEAHTGSLRGEKWGKEDFASLAGKSKDNAGANFKYAYSYEEAGMLIKEFVSAWKVEIEKYFSLVVFNFLFSNGDAHLKNFSLLESAHGDYLLSPAYGLINTRVHVDDADFALDKGLFADSFKSKAFKKGGHPSKNDFIEFARRIGLPERRVEKLLNPFLENQFLVQTLVSRSFLNDANKRGYLLMYNQRRNFMIQ